MATSRWERRRIVLVQSQSFEQTGLEELFTQASAEEERRRFVANLLSAVGRSGPTSVILRSDILGRCAFDPDLNAFVTDHLEQVAPMSRDELRSARGRRG